MGMKNDARESVRKDETELPGDVLMVYKVESDHPRAIYIDKLGVRARVLPMSLNPDTSIQAPINIFDAGWYTGGPKPGEPGAAIIDGHASGPSRQGLFAYVETMAEVMRVHGDGEEGMSMITRTGAWVPGEKTFDTRAVVFTRRVS